MPYMLLRIGYAGLAIGLIAAGAYHRLDSESSLVAGV